ncbi:MAG: type II CAAX endopeptidase family protein [Thermodesulfobacteriota bacterium]|nr:type II CAAX endopeptidase family protein [Thermodesulfobacteriota bacterium]
MTGSEFNGKAVAATVVLAVIFWFITFYLEWGVFWFKIAPAALILAGLSFLLQPAHYLRFSLNWRNILIGLASAALLYLIFWTGKAISTAILPFAADQVGAIYSKGEGTPSWMIVLLLFFVTGPCEEIYWRGFLQRQLMTRLGDGRGWLLATALYAGVHVSSGNFMLIGAAAVAGAFWGAMYWRFRDVSAIIISHSIWSTFIFAVVPVPG